jgi:predicted dehydrogenase
VRDEWRDEHARLIAEALGYPDARALPDDMAHAYNLILGSMIHDIGNLHGLFGPPQRILSSEIWLEGRAVSTVFDYGDGKRAVCSWVDLPELWDFKETLEVYGSRERVLVSFPTGFARGLPSYVTLHGMNADRTPWRQEYQWHDNPFKIELAHFGDCIRAGIQPITTGRDAIADIQLVGNIVKKYLETASS